MNHTRCDINSEFSKFVQVARTLLFRLGMILITYPSEQLAIRC